MLTLQNKTDIYACITTRFKVGEKYPLSAVGKYLSTQGHNARRYGYTQMKNLMKDLTEYISIEEYESEGHSNCNVMIGQWNAPVSAEKKQNETVEKIEKTAETKTVKTSPRPEVKAKNESEEPEGISLTVFQKSNFESFTSGNRNYNNFSRNYGNYRPEEGGDSRNTSGGVRFSGTDNGSTFKTSVPEVKETKEDKRPKAEEGAVENKEEGSSFERLAYLPAKVLDFLERKGMSDPAAELNEAYLRSIKDKTFQHRGNTITFPFDLNGEEKMMAVLKRNEKTYGKPWYLSYVGTQSVEAETLETEEKEEPDDNRPATPGKALEDFADIGFWQEFLKELADAALPEAWDFRGNRENGRFYILKKYIQYTFYRLQQENKVCIAEGNFAAFNTGLVNNRYQDIYACFVPNPKYESNPTLPEWKFESFAIAGQRGKDGYGKLLTSYFNPLPAIPTYYESISDLFYDVNTPLVTDYEHIIIDNIDRLPMEYLEECCFSDEEAQNLLAQVRSSVTREKKKQAYYQLSNYLVENDKIYRRLQARMEDAIDISLKRVRWNFRTAVPCYFPKGNCMSMMLPLALADDNRTDAALVVIKNPSGSYQGQTILEIEKAYLDARLVCRPNNDWMSPESMGFSGRSIPQIPRGEQAGSQAMGARVERGMQERPERTMADRGNMNLRDRTGNEGRRNDFYGRNDTPNPGRGEAYRSDYGRTQNGYTPRYNGYGNRRTDRT